MAARKISVYAWESALYLESILANLRNANEIADHRANILVVMSGLILSFSITQLRDVTGVDKTAFGLISAVSFLTIFITIGVIRPKIGHSKTNTMYHLAIVKFGRDAYEKELLKTVKDVNLIVGEYAEEIYDFSLELRARFRMIRTAADILAAGLAVGLLLLILT
ncbi:MAG: hypothetical protein HY366_00330 [Candidatus Aenigmarchaeota archaeon]|nr:hypothetical protein [Candidatus Aenigmarchaeota archaeon]